MKIFFVIRNFVKFGLFILFSILPLIGSSQCVSGNCFTGTGTFIYNNGSKYSGEWKEDRRHGQGTFNYPSGGKYTGEWKEDKRHGQGTHNYSNGDKYVGEWKDDKHHGQGKKIWSDGSKYEGQWYNGIPKDDTNQGQGNTGNSAFNGERRADTYQGQPHKSTSLGLVCKIQEKCKNCSGTGVKKSGGPGLAFVVKECYKCKGVSNDILYLKPCSKCKNTRKISELDLVEGEPRKTATCSICEGKGDVLHQFKVADADFPMEMNWHDAMNACSSLGGGWRLPNKEELIGMYEFLHKKGKGNFQNNGYWSGSENYSGDAWVVFFNSGNVYGNHGANHVGNLVRAVRDF